MNRNDATGRPALLRRTAARTKTLLFGGLIAASLAQVWAEQKEDKVIQDAGRTLDAIERHLAEWGHASVSSFVLVPDTGFFKLDYERKTAEYVESIHTNLQGRAAFLEQRETELQLKARAANALAGVNVQGPAEPLSTAAQAQNARQESLDQLVHDIRVEQLKREHARVTNSAEGWHTNLFDLSTLQGTQQTSNSTGPTNREPTLPTNSLTASQTAITNSFAPLGGLATDLGGGQLLETTTLKLGVTAKETERVLNFMSHPIDLPGNKKAYFAIGQISVMPGWRTRKDYFCEVSARFSFAGRRADVVRRVREAAERRGDEQLLAAVKKGEVDARQRTIEDVWEVFKAEKMSDINRESKDKPPKKGTSGSSLKLDALSEVLSARKRKSFIEDELKIHLGEPRLKSLNDDAVKALRNVLDVPDEELTNALQNLEYDKWALWNILKHREEEAVARSLNDTVYSYNAHSLGLIDNYSMSLISAFPFTDSQVFDLQSSFRSRISYLLNLAGTYLQAGYKIEAETLLKHVRQIEKDFATRSAFPVVVPSVDATMLTYRFDPEASAMMDPARRKPKAGNQLLPISIPVLVLVVCDRDDLEIWPQIAIEVETRWVPREDRNIWKTVFIDGPWHQRFIDKRMPHARALNLVQRWDSMWEDIYSSSSKETEAFFELDRRKRAFQFLAWGRQIKIDLPTPGPILTRVVPADVPLTPNSPVDLHGENLSGARVRIGGVPATVERINDNQLRVSLPPADQGRFPLPPGAYPIDIETPGGAAQFPDMLRVSSDFSCAGRTFEVRRVMPERGFVNGRSVFIVYGSGFKSDEDPITRVIVGGRLAENVQVLGDGTLQFEVPPWTSSDKTSSPFSQTSRASVFVASRCYATNAPNEVYFDIVLPPAPSAPAKSDLAKKVEVLEGFAKALGNSNAPTLGGVLRLELEANMPTTTNLNGHLSSTVINVQAGQNKNTQSN